MNRIELDITIDHAEIERLKQAITTFADRMGLKSDTRFELTMALEEAVVNIIEHGELTPATGHIHLVLHCRKRIIHIELRDNGRRFDPLQERSPDFEIPFDERKVGGLGIFYLRQMMDNLAYRYADGENILTMQKRIS
ncbi:hypothetical protein C2E25_11660 [Geothermobacter hydrogeniphilus]|uniref:Histidine kinase/HSP90-like ATPase domain-containing protein n=1 Tax=Geothermobacter hydrogeniphilus TaxID=1969733 RepID=A0A2K2H8L4_9BACT|nr:ATP-binding protein [Geothermobacter hydrogeniphilus]PNU19589.1 hypothetical protein C2E25_11660 [Geothermobacter hydrogeniphilus]